ncbi:MAG: nucleotidyltransferase domain-containing protein [Bacteroides sp.]|nr:nucleotidyltransferase domain-containing protein [Bacteroides sp.]MCM1379361.1 nucleotidyltransferase domain-containing protein [Bacteroides sp.]MCM1445221.1 nucleotidyltransferase domain-containing protein [Prevotella sp.]
MKLIESHLAQIITLCKKYKVDKLWVFGSILTSKFNSNSDVDFSVNFDAETIRREGLDWSDIFFGFIHDLEYLLNRRVDMVCDDEVKNSFFRKELDNTKQLIYG